jgi:hypothetical protein
VRLKIAPLSFIFVVLAACADMTEHASDAELTTPISPDTSSPDTSSAETPPVSHASATTPEDVSGTDTDSCELHQIERLLDNRCGACHSMPKFQVPIDCFGSCAPAPIHISDLVDIDKVVPGDSAASRLMIRLYDGSMPPPLSGLPPPSDAEITWLASFIDTLEPGVEPSCTPGDSPAL